MSAPRLHQAALALRWLDRWRYWITGALMAGIWWMGVTEIWSWVIAGPLLILLVWVPAGIRIGRSMLESRDELEAGRRED